MRGDPASGAGIAEAVPHVEIILHGVSSPYRDTQKIDVTGARLLLETARRAGVQYFIYISIVGLEEIPFPYYQRKLDAEALIEEQPVPKSILPATQFHSSLNPRFLPLLFRLPIALIPMDLKFQLIAAKEVAGQLFEVVACEPAGRLPDIGGPEVAPLGEIARTWKAVRCVRRPLVHLPLPGAVADAYRRGYARVPEKAYGRIKWEEWLELRYGQSVCERLVEAG